MSARISRRVFGGAAVSALAFASNLAHAANATAASDLDVRVKTLAGRRVLIAVPRAGAAVTPLRVAVLLHGLGEANDPELGARAWADRYGLLSADARLRHPPVVAEGARGDFPGAELLRVNADLTRLAFQGLAYVCPHMPAPVTPAYFQWLSAELVPALSSELPAFQSMIALGGCSLGGYAALETAARGPSPFSVIACTQAAIGVTDAPRLAPKLSKKMYLATSSQDPYRDANRALVRALESLGKPVTARTFPGPHDQPWLREVGTLDLLLWLDRAL